MEPVLIAEGISKIYRTTQGRVLALESISFQVGGGEFLCIVGPSGCGKTTLLRILGGLLASTRGAVYFHGEPLDSPRRQIGFVFQKANLMPWRTVLKNVTLPLEVQGLRRTDAHALAQELLELVGLGGFEKVYPRELSIGMQQRVAIARALIHDPAILLLDEPFEGLAPVLGEKLGETIRDIQKEGLSILIAESDDKRIDFVEKIHTIERGQILQTKDLDAEGQ